MPLVFTCQIYCTCCITLPALIGSGLYEIQTPAKNNSIVKNITMDLNYKNYRFIVQVIRLYNELTILNIKR